MPPVLPPRPPHAHPTPESLHQQLHERILEVAAAVLADGPCTPAELADALVTAGVDLPRTPGERSDEVAHALLHDSAFVELPDGRLGFVPALLDGVTFSTELDALDAAEGTVALIPDAEPISWWLVTHPPIVDGEVLDVIDTADGQVVVLPEGWLAPEAATVTLRFDGEELDVAPLAEPVDGDGPVPLDEAGEATLTTAVRAAFDRLAEPATFTAPGAAEPVRWAQSSTFELWWALLTEPGTVPRGVVLPPMRRLLPAAALRLDGVRVVPDELDPAISERWALHQSLEVIYDLAGEQVPQAAELILTLRAASAGAADGAPATATAPMGPAATSPASPAAVARLLTDPQVARVAFAHVRNEELDPAAVLGVATAALDAVEERQRTGAHWLAGRALDLLGRPVEAEAHFEVALTRPGTTFAPAAVALAALAADRGDPSRALGLLRQGGVDVDDLDDLGPGGGDAGRYRADEYGTDRYGAVDLDDDELDERIHRHGDTFGYDSGLLLLAEVLPFAVSRPRSGTGRNDPCPCGSGRKYKHCHQGRPDPVPLAERAAWLYAKARRFVAEHETRTALAEVADELARRAELGLDFYATALDSELAADIVLHEAGAMATFLAQRTSLLPADEVALADRWQTIPRAVLLVDRVRPNGVQLRDVRSGERITIGPLAGERPSGLLIGRPLPVGDEWRALGGLVALPDPWRHQALEILADADPLEVASLIGRCLAASLPDDV